MFIFQSFMFLLFFITLTNAKFVHKKKVDDYWPGKWFPFNPNIKYDDNDTKTNNVTINKTNMQEHPKQQCDDGVSSIAIDFDPEDKRFSYNYLCLANRTLYTPDLNRKALLVEHFIPPAYVPPIKCINESISYEETLPTYGAYRPAAPKYGSYKYLPPQRWIHSLADGAIVFLYHPCAFSGQIKTLENTLSGCMYRHIITPSQALSPERPLALLAWGKCLQMSVVDDRLVVDFIKKNAKLGYKAKQESQAATKSSYIAGLSSEAHLITDEQDTELCGYTQM